MMLVAELHGKSLEFARNSEDYLTSAVFGHLRYVPPSVFWPDFLAVAQSVPEPGEMEVHLGQTLRTAGIDLALYDRLETRFWVYHPTLGEPDLLLFFSGGPQPPLVVLAEVKLWAGKSGCGGDDQLIRYLGILDDLAAVDPRLPRGAGRYLIYLTPRESLLEVEDSLAQSADSARDRRRLFRLKWQDLLVAARHSAAMALEPARTILSDVASFLSRIGLEYFDRFGRINGLPMLVPGDGAIFRGGPAAQVLMTRLSELEPITIRSASWVT